MSRFIIWLLAFITLAEPASAAILDVEAENVKKSTERVEAYGNVNISGEDLKLNANYVVYDTVTEDLWAVGNCHLEEKSGEIDAEVVYYNTKRKDFRLENGSVLIYKEPVIISGESVTRYGEDQYEGERIKFTPCLGMPPSWSLAARSLDAPLEKYGDATHVRFQVRDYPLIYFPYLYFPIKIQRHSGFLMPNFSNSTDIGTRIGIPYYIVLGRSADATITPNFLSKRGVFNVGEFRYRLNETEYGEIYVEGLLNDKLGGDGFAGGVNGLPRGTVFSDSPNALSAEIPDNRWLIRSFQKGGSLNWDIKVVSTPDYFRDIGSMASDETVWKDTTNTGQGRSLESLVSRVQYNDSWKGFTANVSGVWKQNLTIPDNDRTLQELPRISLRMNQRAVPHTPAFVSAELNTVNIHTIDWIRAIKDNAQVRMAVPLTYFPYFTLMPTYTQYYRDVHITENPGTFQSSDYETRWQDRDSSLSRQYNYSFFNNNPGIFDQGLYRELWGKRDISLTTNLYSQRFLGGLYHQVVPTVSWTYLSRIGGNYDPTDADDFYPEFLGEDDWNKEFKMTVGFNNYIRDKQGRSLMEVSLSRIYDYLIKEWDYYEANIVLNPVSWISIRHLNRFGKKPHFYATLEHWTQFAVSDPRGDSLYITEEFNTNDVKSGLLGVRVVLTKELAARHEMKYDFLRHGFNYSKQGLTWTSQCWSIDIFRDVDTTVDNLPRDTTIGITINLLGLGQVISTKRSFEGSNGQ